MGISSYLILTMSYYSKKKNIKLVERFATYPRKCEDTKRKIFLENIWVITVGMGIGFIDSDIQKRFFKNGGIALRTYLDMVNKINGG